MKYCPLGRTGWNVSEISFGAWAIGGAWGDVSDEESLRALHAAVDGGVNFIDTADVYGDGRSERLVAQLKSERPRDTIYVATKAGRRLSPHNSAGYNKQNLTAFVDRSLKNLSTETIDLIQLHCPPTEVYDRPEVFGALDDLVKAGKLRFYGVSVEKIAEALRAIEYPNIQSVQIIFNLFRPRPAEQFLPRAREKKVGVLARVPLASGLLSGKMTKQTQFAADDHRNFNRVGQAFDAGETFSGLGDHLDDAFAAVAELKKLVPAGSTLAAFALRWILMDAGVTCAIPGAKRPDQVADNIAAADLPALTEKQMAACRAVYDRFIRAHSLALVIQMADEEPKAKRLSPVKWALGFAGLVAVLVVCGGLPLYLRGLPPGASAPPTPFGGVIMAMLGVIAFAIGALMYGVVLLTHCFTFDFRFPIFATLKYRAWLANLVVGLFLQGGVAFIALPFLHPLLLSFLPAKAAFIIAFFGPFVVMQFVMIWVMIWAPLDRMCIRRRMSAIGISPEQVKEGWYMGISDAKRGTMKRFPSIEEDIGVLWLEASRILYYGDTQAWEVPHEKLLEIERKAEAGSTSAYFGGVNVIIRFLDAEGKERRVRLHPQGDWTRTTQTTRFNLLADRLMAWREKPSAGWFHAEPAGFAVEPRVQ